MRGFNAMAKERVLIIEPHSDDGVISIGGFLEKFRDRYEYHFCLITASDLNMHHAGLVTRQQRLDEYQAYVDFYNGTWFRGMESKELPIDEESKLDVFPRRDLVRYCEQAIQSCEPHILMVPGPSFHHDHTAVYEATIAATRPTARTIPRELYVLENPTYVHEIDPTSSFIPDTYVDLSEELLKKKLQCFRESFPSQVRENDNYLSEEGIKSWARYRGLEARTRYAEAIHTYLRVI